MLSEGALSDNLDSLTHALLRSLDDSGRADTRCEMQQRMKGNGTAGPPASIGRMGH